MPEVDESKCTYCRACSKACRHSAILVLKEKILTFPKLCHGCGGCALACPEDAVREVPRSIGVVEEGASGRMAFVQGRLDVGEAMSPPVIRAVLDSAPDGHTLVMDAPPGTSCPVIESVKTADAVLLVTEPTPFGLNDLKLAVDMVRALGLPLGVAINRVGVGDRKVFSYCQKEDIPILLELPDDREIAEAYSRGELALLALPKLRPLFENLATGLRKLARGPRPKVVPRAEPVQMPDQLPQPPSENMPPGQAHSVRELVVISGKLVSLVRREARAIAGFQDRDLLIADGSPGIGCPVIASITGARMALVVTEPTLHACTGEG